MARCCPPLAAAHPRLSSLPLLFIPPFRKHSDSLHILSPSALIFLIFLSLALSLSYSLHLDVVSVYQDRLEVAAAIFRWQHPPSLPPCLLFLPLFLSLYLPCASTSALIIDSISSLGGPVTSPQLTVNDRKCEPSWFYICWCHKAWMTSGWSSEKKPKNDRSLRFYFNLNKNIYKYFRFILIFFFFNFLLHVGGK